MSASFMVPNCWKTIERVKSCADDQEEDYEYPDCLIERRPRRMLAWLDPALRKRIVSSTDQQNESYKAEEARRQLKVLDSYCLSPEREQLAKRRNCYGGDIDPPPTLIIRPYIARRALSVLIRRFQ